MRTARNGKIQTKVGTALPQAGGGGWVRAKHRALASIPAAASGNLSQSTRYHMQIPYEITYHIINSYCSPRLPTGKRSMWKEDIEMVNIEKTKY